MVGQQPVKSSAVFRSQRLRPSWRRSGTLAGAGFGLLAVLGAPEAQGENARQGRPLLLGGAVQPTKSPVRLDPVLPHGEHRTRPASPLMKQKRCSQTRPLCVGTDADLEGSELDVALGLLVRAYEEHSFGAGLHRPRSRGEGPLLWIIDEAQSLTLSLSLVPSRGFDRGRADCRGGLVTPEAARKCVTQAALAETAPATASWLREGVAAHTSRALGEAPETALAISESLAHPQVGILTSTQTTRQWRDEERVDVSRERSVRFFDYLESRSAQHFGHAAWLSLTLGATETEAGASRFEAEPDLLDVLHATVQGDVTALARLLDDFSQESVVAAQAQGFSFEPDWVLEGNTLPRNVALPMPLEPTGSGYVRVLLTPAQRKQVMAFKMICEAPVSYVWSVARLAESGKVLSTVPVAYSERGRQAATRIEPEESTVALLLSGTNMGGIDLAHPFDPDHEPHEAHACSVYVSALTQSASPASTADK